MTKLLNNMTWKLQAGVMTKSVGDAKNEIGAIYDKVKGN
jgi:hypothetical protein